jgi:hypothetical protein
MEQLKRYNLQWDSDHPEKAPKIIKVSNGFWVTAEGSLRNEYELVKQIENLIKTHKREINQVKDESLDKIAQINNDHEQVVNKLTLEIKRLTDEH